MLSLNQSYLYLSMLSIFFFSGYANNKIISEPNEPVLIVELTNQDNEAIKSAKVVLTALDSKAIQAKYDKKKSLYYFNHIPDNYHTIEVSHQLYQTIGSTFFENKSDSLYFKLEKKGEGELYSYSNVAVSGRCSIVDVIELDKVIFLIVKADSMSKKGHSYSKYVRRLCKKYKLRQTKKYNYLYNAPSLFQDLQNRGHTGFQYYFLRRRNGRSFRRYNDEILGKLRKEDHIFQIAQIYGFRRKIRDKGIVSKSMMNYNFITPDLFVHLKEQYDYNSRSKIAKKIYNWNGKCKNPFQKYLGVSDCSVEEGNPIFLHLPDEIGFGILDFMKEIIGENPNVTSVSSILLNIFHME